MGVVYANGVALDISMLTDTAGKLYAIPVVRATVTYGASDLVFIYAFECNAGGGV